MYKYTYYYKKYIYTYYYKKYIYKLMLYSTHYCNQIVTVLLECNAQNGFSKKGTA